MFSISLGGNKEGETGSVERGGADKYQVRGLPVKSGVSVDYA